MKPVVKCLGQIVLLVSIFYGCGISFAQTASKADPAAYQDILDLLDKEMSLVDDRSVLDSISSEANPNVNELCTYIIDEKYSSLADALANNRDTIFQKSVAGSYYSPREYLSEFQCRQDIREGYQPAEPMARMTVIEFGIANIENGGEKILIQLLEKLASLTFEDRRQVVFSKNQAGDNLIDFIKSVKNRYEGELKSVGLTIDQTGILWSSFTMAERRIKNAGQCYKIPESWTDGICDRNIQVISK